jgi:hypothetical protein
VDERFFDVHFNPEGTDGPTLAIFYNVFAYLRTRGFY